MVLTAIDTDGKDYTPQAKIASGANPSVVKTAMRELQKTKGLYCLDCYRALGKITEDIKVFYRSGVPESENRKARSAHFFHEKKEDSMPCANRGETDVHLFAKDWVAYFLKSNDPWGEAYGLGEIVDLSVDKVVLDTGDGQKRKPDILTYYNDGSMISHEIQCSQIPTDIFIARTKDTLNKCVTIVWWIERKLYRKNRDWREYLSGKGIDFKCFWIDKETDELHWHNGAKPKPFQQRKQAKPVLKTRCFLLAKPKSKFEKQLEEAAKLKKIQKAIAKQKAKDEAENQKRTRFLWKIDALIARADAIEKTFEVRIKAIKARGEALKPKKNQIVGHKRKPGFQGVIIDPKPWGCSEMVDVEWVKCAEGSITPRSPMRYNLKDLILSESVMA